MWVALRDLRLRIHTQLGRVWIQAVHKKPEQETRPRERLATALLERQSHDLGQREVPHLIHTQTSPASHVPQASAHERATMSR